MGCDKVKNSKKYHKPKLKVHGDLKKITAGPPITGEGDAIYNDSG